MERHVEFWIRKWLDFELWSSYSLTDGAVCSEAFGALASQSTGSRPRISECPLAEFGHARERTGRKGYSTEQDLSSLHSFCEQLPILNMSTLLFHEVIHLVGASAFTTSLHYLQPLQTGLPGSTECDKRAMEPVGVAPVRRLRIGKVGTSGCPTGTTFRAATSTAWHISYHPPQSSVGPFSAARA